MLRAAIIVLVASAAAAQPPAVDEAAARLGFDAAAVSAAARGQIMVRDQPASSGRDIATKAILPRSHARKSGRPSRFWVSSPSVRARWRIARSYRSQARSYPPLAAPRVILREGRRGAAIRVPCLALFSFPLLCSYSDPILQVSRFIAQCAG